MRRNEMRPTQHQSIDGLIQQIDEAGLTIIDQCVIHNCHGKNGEVNIIAKDFEQHYFFKYKQTYTPQAYNWARKEYRQYLQQHPQTTNGYIITLTIAKGL